MKISTFFITIVLLFAISCADTEKKDQPEWTYLFNGNDLSGWIQRGGSADFNAVDSMIVGTAVWNTPNSFLCTENNYSDFILEVDFKVEGDMNTGIQIRSLSDSAYQNGRVHGYQVEIDPSERAYSGGIYDEARRGWLYPLNDSTNKKSREAYKVHEWNHFRIEAIGNRIKTWLNDVPVSNLADEWDSSGFIALQVHTIRDSSLIGTGVMWKNIRIITKDAEKYSLETSAPERAYLINKQTGRKST